MSWSSRIFLCAALVAAGALTFMVTRQRQLTPAEQLSELEAKVAQRQQHSEEVLLRGLESVADQAAARGETDVAARALTTRGRMLLDLGAAPRARDDFQRVLDQYLPGDLETRRLVAHALIASGQPEEALGTLSELLAEQPDYGPAWIEAGDLHREIAAGHLARCNVLLARILTRASQLAAQPLLERFAAQDLADPRRRTTLLRLRELAPALESELFARALLLADDASRELDLARAAYARSLELEPDPAAVAGLITILFDAGELDAAADLGRVVRRRVAFTDDPAINGLLLRVHMQRGDLRAAAQSARSVMLTPTLDTELLLLVSRALYETRDYQNLLGRDGVLMRLRQSTEGLAPIASLYTGLVIAIGNDPAMAIPNLRVFAISDVADPFPNARLLAWSESARVARAIGDPYAEREALHAALQLAPDADADHWFRLYELQSEGAGASSALPLASLTQALRLAPERAEEWMPLWRALGERSLSEDGIDLPSFFAGLELRGQALPLGPANPYLVFRLAELWLEAKDFARLRFVTRRLLEDQPGFLPGLDLALAASFELERWYDACEQVVQRIEAVGLDARGQALLAKLPSDRLSTRQVMRLMEAAPEREGRRVLAQRLRRDGRPELALASLGEGPLRGDAAGQVLRAQLLLEAGDYRRAAIAAGEVEADAVGGGALAAEARRVGLLATLRTQAVEDVHDLIAAALADPERRVADLLPLADLLLGFGEVDFARTLIDGIDQPDEERNDGLFLAHAVAALLADDVDVARLALVRAEFFSGSSRPSLGLLLARVQQKDWRAAAQLARELRSDERTASPRDVLLALIEERAEEAAELADEVADSSPADLYAQLTRAVARLAAGLEPEMPGVEADGLRELALGSDDAPRDPRQTAALLLALDTAPFVPLARRELQALLRTDRARPWAVLLQARADLALGDVAAVQRALEALTRNHGTFEPAWLELEALLTSRLAPDHADRIVFDARRNRSLAARDEEQPLTHVARARVLLTRERFQEALESAERALELDPTITEARAAQAAALTALGETLEAVEAWQRACLGNARASVREHVPPFLVTLRAGLESRPPTLMRAQVELVLERLRERLPDDPWIVLEQARLDLDADSTKTQAALVRAHARLTSFRERHAGVPLDRLRRGSAERWGSLLLEVDPREALVFVAEELELDPAHVELRVLFARALRMDGRATEALVHLERLGQMVTDPRVELERAACLVATGATVQEIERVLAQVETLRGDGAPSAPVDLLRARARLAGGPQARADVLEGLERSWDKRRATLSAAAGPELVYLYVLHLALGDPRAAVEAARAGARAADPSGAAAAAAALIAVDADEVSRVVRGLLPHTRDPYRKTVLEAVAGVVAHAEAVAANSQ